MNDLMLKASFVDRAGRVVFVVCHETECPNCGKTVWTPTGQKIRFGLTNDHKLDVRNVMVEGGE